MIRLRIALVLLLAVVLLAGCGGDNSDDQLDTDYQGASRMGEPRRHDGEGMEIRILPYFGADLYCVESGSAGNHTYALSCDFYGWHQKNDPK